LTHFAPYSMIKLQIMDKKAVQFFTLASIFRPRPDPLLELCRKGNPPPEVTISVNVPKCDYEYLTQLYKDSVARGDPSVPID